MVRILAQKTEHLQWPQTSTLAGTMVRTHLDLEAVTPGDCLGWALCSDTELHLLLAGLMCPGWMLGHTGSSVPRLAVVVPDGPAFSTRTGCHYYLPSKVTLFVVQVMALSYWKLCLHQRGTLCVVYACKACSPRTWKAEETGSGVWG